jgi:predicted nucleotidyltransferase component of viral defense system
MTLQDRGVSLISRDEIDAKAAAFGIHASNVQRDYVFGWLLRGLLETPLAPILVLKGGNALRKAYFPATRFSEDLDFSASSGLGADFLERGFNDVCRYVAGRAGVHFHLERNGVFDEHYIDKEKRVFKMRLYFQNFHDEPEHIILKVLLDVTEYDRIALPVQTRPLIHPYSDAADCAADVRVVKLEEALADKLKCLLQRRYAFDLFDLVYGVFVNRVIEVNRREVIQTFLGKTIFEGSPATALQLLLGAPLDLLRGFWDRIVAPRTTQIAFEDASTLFRDGLSGLFASFGARGAHPSMFFPAELRNPILQGAADRTLLRVTYDGVTRYAEPYSLVFRKRLDGVAREYLYVYDRTGGSSGPGIKSWPRSGIQRLVNTDIPFEPRYPVELSKAGDRETAGYFAKDPYTPRTRGRISSSSSAYSVECLACGKRFRRATYSTRLNAHKNEYGSACYGRVGYIV